MSALSSTAKHVLPEFVWSPARRLLTAVWTPVRFSLRTGHFRSALAARAVDRVGEPMIWYTYPAIDFLGAQDFTGRTVLEFGAGQSTLWWAKRAAHVVAVEGNAEWHGYIRGRMPANVELHLAPDDLTGVDAILADRTFDVVVVDGLDRLRAARVAADRVRPDGCVVVDNSEGYWGGDGAGTFPILDHLREQRFQRVDFYGFAPGVIETHCTSLFFRAQSFIVAGHGNVVRGKYPAG